VQGNRNWDLDPWVCTGWAIALCVGSVGYAPRAISAPALSGAAQSQTGKTTEDGVLLTHHVHQVAAYLTGVLETSVPSTSKPGPPRRIQMTTCPVQQLAQVAQVAQAGAVLLYQEQAPIEQLNQPYRQRFLSIAASPYSQTVRSLAFKPANPQQWVNFCTRDIRDRQIHAHDLGTPICSVFLKPSQNAQGEAIYYGNTPVDGCPASIRGAVRITNHILLYKTGMETWDRGFDSQGKQVWGARAEAYRYRKIK
jgi:CpeT/CpcT family (DUF1001)